jgi:hypothetical protein
MFQHSRVSAGDAALGVRFAGKGPNRLAVAGRLVHEFRSGQPNVGGG